MMDEYGWLTIVGYKLCSQAQTPTHPSIALVHWAEHSKQSYFLWHTWRTLIITKMQTVSISLLLLMGNSKFMGMSPSLNCGSHHQLYKLRLAKFGVIVPGQGPAWVTWNIWFCQIPGFCWASSWDFIKIFSLIHCALAADVIVIQYFKLASTTSLRNVL